MAHATISAPLGARTGNSRVKQAGAVIAWAGVVTLAVLFVLKYVLFYFRHYDPVSFDIYWPRRGWLFLHMTGGTVALLTGPLQFWTGLRKRNMAFHRWTGRLFLAGITLGVAGSVGLAVTTTNGWAFETALMGLALAWATTAAIAYVSIRKLLIDMHKEWMIRAYVVTFAFVTFRFLQEYSPLSRLRPENDRDTTIAWACWVVPLAITELLFQIRRMNRALATRQTR